VNQLLKSVVRKICTLRSVGAGAGDRSGHPVATSNGRPHRDNYTIIVEEIALQQQLRAAHWPDKS
jgi:hypothetical protein